MLDNQVKKSSNLNQKSSVSYKNVPLFEFSVVIQPRMNRGLGKPESFYAAVLSAKKFFSLQKNVQILTENMEQSSWEKVCII